MEESLDIHIPWPGWHAVRRLGRGSYGSVWEIEREVAGKPERCALKAVGVPPEGGYDDSLDMGYDEESVTAAYGERADTVLGEYQLMASLAHPNVISVRDVGKVRHEDTPGYDVFIRMELLEPLPAWARGRSVSPVDVAHVGRDIASALAACESEGIVHRDVKPANIFADRWGTFKLGDFGVARNLEGTCTATMAGTQSYMAPEVARHERYNQTVDIYSLGLVMWWLLSGFRLPFMPEGRLSPGDNTRAEARRLAGETIPAPAGCPAELARVVLKACSYRPGDRYQSAMELVADLEECLSLRFTEKSEALEEVAPLPSVEPAPKEEHAEEKTERKDIFVASPVYGRVTRIESIDNETPSIEIMMKKDTNMFYSPSVGRLVVREVPTFRYSIQTEEGVTVTVLAKATYPNGGFLRFYGVEVETKRSALSLGDRVARFESHGTNSTARLRYATISVTIMLYGSDITADALVAEGDIVSPDDRILKVTKAVPAIAKSEAPADAEAPHDGQGGNASLLQPDEDDLNWRNADDATIGVRYRP